MTTVETDIRSTPEVLRQTHACVAERRPDLDTVLSGPLVLLGSGSSYCIGVSASSMYEAVRGRPAQAILGSEYRARPGWTHLVVSRTGKTTEAVEAMRRARSVGAPLGLIVGDTGSPAEDLADAVVHLEFAPEKGIIQTRFITAALFALRLLIETQPSETAGHTLSGEVTRGLESFEAQALSGFRHIVFLGRGPQYGMALSAALTMAETALLPAEGHHTLDYRHGPIALADDRSLVWCFDPSDDPLAAGVIEEVRRTGARVAWHSGDPIVSLVQAQYLALCVAEARGINPDAPRNLQRAIVLPAS